MNTSPYWLLTDASGQTTAGGSTWFRWSRGVTHTVWSARISGYCADSVHLPYLMDPIYERYGPTARLWLSEVWDPRSTDPVRVASNSWTILDEWERPAWVGGESDRRVRLRFALLAAGTAHPNPGFGARIRTVALHDIHAAAGQIETICAESRRVSRVPQATCLAAMAVRAAAALGDGTPQLADLVSRHYPVHAWYAAMAAACACVDLQELADAAVRQERRTVAPRLVARTMAVV